MVIHHNPNMMHLPAKIHNTPSQNAQERVLNAHILWANMNPAMRCSSGPQTSLSEAGENLGGTMRPRLTSMSEPNQSWETVVTKDNVPDKAVDDDGPLDLSESGRAKAVKNLEKTPDSVVSIADLLRSTSSSSPPAPSSSSVGSSGSQSEQRLGELTWQVRNIKASLGTRPTSVKTKVWQLIHCSPLLHYQKPKNQSWPFNQQGRLYMIHNQLRFYFLGWAMNMYYPLNCVKKTAIKTTVHMTHFWKEFMPEIHIKCHGDYVPGNGKTITCCQVTQSQFWLMWLIVPRLRKGMILTLRGVERQLITLEKCRYFASNKDKDNSGMTVDTDCILCWL